MAVVDTKATSADARRTEDAFLDALARDIERQVCDGEPILCLDAVLKNSPWSRRQTERLFRERFLTSPLRYFRDCQQDKAFALLSSGKDVLSAALESGFASTGRLHDAVVARRGMTPGEVRRKGAGVTVRYGFFDTPLGAVLVAATERGICALRFCQLSAQEEVEGVLLGDVALAEVETDFPAATIVEDAAAVEEYAFQLVAYLESRAETFAPRVDILSGTTFQREVWSELQKLHPGDVISYRELAARLGRPGASRAVATACGANHLCIAIPCHRVLRADGSMAGYRWGKNWKERLLALEMQKRQLAV